MSEGDAADPPFGVDDTQSANPDSVEALVTDLEEIGESADGNTTDEDVEELEALLVAAHQRGLLDSRVRHLDLTDAVEALVGSVVFASPLLVEDGVFDIGEHLFRSTPFGIPIFLIANTVFVVVLTYALLEWTGRDKTERRDVLGIIPARLLMILGISFVVAAVMMTVWGRVGLWSNPTEALARVNVVWTIGAIGAALGDIISTDQMRHGSNASMSDGAPAPGPAEAGSDPPATVEDSELVSAIQASFDSLESTLESPSGRSEARRLRERTTEAALENTFGREIRKYTGRDIAEAFVGSVIFSIPFLVEDGVFDVADYFLSFQVGLFPIFFLVNAAFVFAMIWTLVFWAGPQDVRVSRPLFGVIPRRLVGIGLVSFLTAAALMTMWGRVGTWADPTVAIARISVVWTVASFGASLGDVLPGESSGDDINDDLSDLGAQVGLGDDDDPP